MRRASRPPERGDAAAHGQRDDLVATHGFRITNYRVENETENPRLCITFSENVKAGDLGDFVAVNGKAAERVDVSGSQLCVTGFEHGKSFEVLVRAGLPSRGAEALQKNAELQIYVRDRSSSVRCPSAYSRTASNIAELIVSINAANRSATRLMAISG